MTLKYLLVDHDDTLMATFELRARVMQWAVQEVFAVSVDGAAFMRKSHGKSLELMAAEFTDDAQQIAQLVNVYRSRYYTMNTAAGGISPLPGIADMLEALTNARVPVMVVTSKLGRGAKDELAACELLQYVRGVIGSEDVTHPKPHPEPLLRGLAFIDAAADETLMIGDTSADVLGAKAAGVKSAAALWGASDAAGLIATQPDHVLSRPADVLPLFGL